MGRKREKQTYTAEELHTFALCKKYLLTQEGMGALSVSKICNIEIPGRKRHPILILTPQHMLFCPIHNGELHPSVVMHTRVKAIPYTDEDGRIRYKWNKALENARQQTFNPLHDALIQTDE